MWFALSIVALFMQTTRRSSEKRVSKNIDSMAMTWLQQAVALPFIVGTLFLARFYMPTDMSAQFWQLMVVYVVCSSLDVYFYFKAISIADISYVAPLLTLFAVGNLAGAYVVLGQVPTLYGMIGAVLIMTGAFLHNVAKRRQARHIKANQLALLLVLGSVLLRSFYANIEVIMLRETNPTSYNFYSTIACIPFVLLVSAVVLRSRRTHYQAYWRTVREGVSKHYWPLLLVGVTYTINLLATYQAKLIAPNAGYVGAIKSASVLPTVLIGIFFFKEKVVRLQWLGLVCILFGLIVISLQ